MTSNGKKQSFGNTNPPTPGTVSTLSLGLQGLGLKELITEDDLAIQDSKDVVMVEGELEGLVDFEDISELAEDEDQVNVGDEDDMDGDLSIRSETFTMDEGEEGMDEAVGFFPKKTRIKFTDVMSSRALKRTGNLPRTKPLKPHKGPLIQVPDQVEAFLSWQAGPFPEKRTGKYRIILAAEVKKSTRVVKTLAALERAKEALPPEESDRLTALDKKQLAVDENIEMKRKYYAINLMHWEYLFEDQQRPAQPKLTPFFAQMGDHDSKHSVHRIKNQDLDSDKWLDAVIVDPRTVSTNAVIASTKLQLPLSDPFLYFDITQPETLHSQLSLAERLIAEKLRRLRQQQQSRAASILSGHATPNLSATFTIPEVINYAKCQTDDRFNLSLDRVYEKRRRHLPPVILASSVAARALSRKHIAGQVLQHSVPAIKMLSPFYKTMPSVLELRSFNRPAFDVEGCEEIKFSPLHIGPPSKSAIIKTSKQLTLGDDSPFILVEYSEERPLIMSNPGMASQLLHYYRKHSPKDTYTPPNNTGVPYKLESTDPSPFLGFGDVPVGQIQPALVNNMAKAPAFFHPPQSTDFIICRQDPKQEDEIVETPSFYLRSINALFLVGQQLPLVEVPAPNSRTLNNIYKGRLQIVAHRSFLKSLSTVGEPLMRILKIYAIFPYISEGSLRKWCKEFADTVRNVKKGDHGTWRKREDLPEWTEDELRSFVSPEQCCAADSTLSGQQAVADARYIRQLVQSPSDATSGVTDEAMNTEEDDMSSQADTATQADSTSRPSVNNLKSNLPEIRLSPWHLSSNFRGALAGKLILDLSGHADPSHSGAGFSFLRLPQRMAQTQRMFNLGPTAAPASSQSGTASPRPPINPVAANQPRAGDPLPSHRHEIARIWQAQWRWLSDTTIPPNLHSILPSRITPYTGQYTPPPQSRTALPPEVAKRSMVIRGGQIVAEGEEEEEDFSQFLKDKKPPLVPTASQQPGMTSRVELIIERIYSEGDTSRTERQVITDPLIIAAYRRERPIYDKRKDARRVTYKDTPITLRRRKHPKDISGAICTSCGLIGHTRTSRSCPRYREYKGGDGKSLLRSGDLPLEQTGLRIGEDGKICITKASLERVDASMKQQMRMVIPLKSIKESTAIVVPPPHPSQKDFRDEKRVQKAEAAGSLARIFLDIVDELLKHPLVDPFARPVSKKKYPMYYRLIPKPRDLATIRKKLLIQQQMPMTKSIKARPRYSRGSQFMGDIELIHSNCLAFNGADHVFTKTTAELLEMARRMYKERVEEIRELEKVILGEKYSEEEYVRVSGSEIEVDEGEEAVGRDFFDSSMQSMPLSSQQPHPMTELERMIRELGEHAPPKTNSTLSPIAPSERSVEEKPSEGREGVDEAANKVRLKLFLRK